MKSYPSFIAIISLILIIGLETDSHAQSSKDVRSPFQSKFPIPEMTSLQKDLKPFTYIDAKIPFYPPGGPRKGDGDWNKMQLPLPPEESIKHFVTPGGFEIKLFASEPDIVNPICMAWDEQGRLWIAESVDYPNDIQPPGKGNDRITICEDTDGDGRADKFTIFADKLSIPTSLTFSRGGVIVHQAPQTLFLKDTNGDDQADVRKVLFEGWSTGDTHAGPSNLQYGLDNWIWGMQGYAGFNGKVGQEHHRFSMGFYRFKPDGSQLEFLRSTNNNTWGIGFSEEGIVFGSTANRNPSVYMPIPNRYYEQVRGWSASRLGTIADTHLFQPITKKVRQVDQHGGYTAAAGHALYTARTYPKEYWNRTSFVCGPTGHLVGTLVIRQGGANFKSRYAFNLLAGDDEWSAPIMAEVGPDGNVWVIDWYNYIIQHNPTPVGFKTGKGNAYINKLRDKKHGRIYRVVYKKSQTSALSLKDATPEKLVETLTHPNMLWRKHAQRLLIERGELDVVPALVQLASHQQTDEIGLNVGAIHALWTLQGLGALRGNHPQATRVVVDCLRHPSAGVRRNAALLLPQCHGTKPGQITSAGLLNDADPQVRLASLLALADFSPSEAEVAVALVEMLQESENFNDRWLLDAATSAAAAHDVDFLIALSRNQENPQPSQVTKIAGIVAEHLARGKEGDSLLQVLKALPAASPELAEGIITGLAKGWPRGQKLQLDENADKALAQLLKKSSPGSRAQLVKLASTWGSGNLENYTREIVSSFLATLQNTKLSDQDRVTAARQLVSFRPDDSQVVTDLMELLSPQSTPTLVSGVIDSLGESRADNVGPELVKRLPQMTPTGKAAALRVLLSRPEATRVLLEGIEKQRISLGELTLDQKQSLATHPNPQIASRAKKLIAQGGGLPSPDRDKVLRELMPLTKKEGDAKLGKLVFEKHCAKCHVHSSKGQNIGPDLTGMAVHPKAELLTHIIDPSRSVEGNYRIYTVATLEGKVLSGLLASETKTTIELIDTEAKKHVVQRQDIDQLIASPRSLMPDGFEKQIPQQELVHLLTFLTHRGQYLPLDLRKVATVVSTKGMFYSEDSKVERLIFSDWSPKTFAGVPFHLVNPQGHRVPNVILLYGPRGKIPPRMPKAVQLPCNSSAKIIHLLSGVSGWGAQRPMQNGTVSMVVRLHYEDGQKEDHKLLNGQHFADYIGRYDVPQSKFAFALRNQQMRYLAIHPQRETAIEHIELLSGFDHTAPIVMAVTVEPRE